MKKSKRSTRKSSIQHSHKSKTLRTQLTPEKLPEKKAVVPATSKLPGWITWLDEHILLLLSGFLFAFIPLYPKIPLADVIPGYIVRLRLEDLFVALTAGIFILQIWRKKVSIKMPVTWIVGAYAVIGIFSMISAVFVTQTVPFELIHVGKTALHYFRYLEYFSLLFVAYSAIKKSSHVYILLGVLAVTVLGISIYGYGQKYYYWPVYSTMNREFSKGVRLYLTEHARVQSTFGGHYDMAGYLVIALPMLLAGFYGVKKWKYKIPLLLSYITGVWLLIMSASRTSFVAFLLGIGIVILIFGIFQTRWKKLTWTFSRGTVMLFLVMYMFVKYGDSIYERFLQTLQAYPELHDTYHTLNDKRRHFYRDYIQPYVEGSFILPQAQKPQNAISTDELAIREATASNILVSSDTRPVATRPADVYEDIPDIIYEATVEGGVATVTAREVPRTYSDTAQRFGLSMAIRLDTLWPRALQGFYTNPLLGTGYATLTKDSVTQFTEAESTDNNFLRTLGETGLLGFLSFYGVIFVSMYFSYKALRKHEVNDLVKIMAIGYIGASVGLLLNATYIDVYAASKIAFSYWALTGITLAVVLKLSDQKSKKLSA